MFHGMTDERDTLPQRATALAPPSLGRIWFNIVVLGLALGVGLVYGYYKAIQGVRAMRARGLSPLKYVWPMLFWPVLIVLLAGIGTIVDGSLSSPKAASSAVSESSPRLSPAPLSTTAPTVTPAPTGPLSARPVVAGIVRVVRLSAPPSDDEFAKIGAAAKSAWGGSPSPPRTTHKPCEVGKKKIELPIKV
jgi:hypothetical protein